MSFKTRFAPSPTGYLHVGGARTALYCWLEARRLAGRYVLRIEDTDLERSTEEAVDAILESLEWLGLTSDEPPVYQTARFDKYHEAIDQLLEQGDAYRCFCSRERLDELRDAQRAAGVKPKYDGHCRTVKESIDDRPYVIRFKTPESGVTQFDDLVRGSVSFDNSELDDLIVQRSDGSPTYNLSVVVDDADMGITCVIRGDDHINNTPRQINIYQALCYDLPKFAHVPMILGEDGSRLSKRHGAVGVMEYEKQGFLPEALLNYLIRLGWSHEDQEIFSRQEMIELFDVNNVNKAPSTFNVEKLRWLNQQHMMSADCDYLAALVKQELERQGLVADEHHDLRQIAEVFRERAKTVVELVEESAYLFADTIEYDETAARKHLRPIVKMPFSKLKERLELLNTWSADAIEHELKLVLDTFELKMPKLALPVRVAVVGKAASPSIGITLELLGKPETLSRMDQAEQYIEKRIEAT